MARTSRKGAALQTATIPAQRVWNTAVYARLSSEDSGRKGADTIDTQIELVVSYISERPHLSLCGTYVDNGSSGKDFDRPAWNRLMDDIRAGKVDAVAVKDLSRFGRNYIETCEMLEKIFPFMGVRFLSVNDGYDSEHEGGYSEGLIVALKNLVNDQYIKDISRKLSASHQARRERGEYTGAAPYGYKKSDSVKGRLEPDEETAPIVRQIFEWRAEGMGHYAICKRLDEMGVHTPIGRQREKYGIFNSDFYKASVWQPRAVKLMVRNRVYLGYLELGKIRQSISERKPYTIIPESEWHVVEGAHEPLVSRELWEKANAVEQAKRAEFFDTHQNNDYPSNLFRGFLVCGACGSKLVRMHRKRTNKNGTVYDKYSYKCPLRRQHDEAQQFPQVLYDVIYNAVLPIVAAQIKMAANLGAVIEKWHKRQGNPRAAIDADISRATRELETINNRLAGLYESFVDKLLSEREYVQVKDNYERQAESLRKKTEELSLRVAVITDVSASDNHWLAAARSFQNPEALTREMLEAIVERITVSGRNDVRVAWKFRDEFAALEECAGYSTKTGKEGA